MDAQPCRTGNLPDDYHPKDWPLFTKEEFGLLTSRTVSQDGRSQVILDDLPPIYDQGDIGSCTANATLAALRYAHHKYTKIPYTHWEPSRLFLYYRARVRDDLRFADISTKDAAPDRMARAKKDSGTKNRVCINTLLIDGVCSEAMWPYGTPRSEHDQFVNLGLPPNPLEPENMAAAEHEARRSRHPGRQTADIEQPDFFPRAISFYRIFDPSKREAVKAETWKWDELPPITVLEQTIRNGWPFIFGMPILNIADPRTQWETKDGAYVLDGNGHKKLERSDIDEDGVLAPPPLNTAAHDYATDGRHAMMVVGFDSEKRRFLVQNSWGTEEWLPKCAEKMQGRMWMPYEWFEQEYMWSTVNPEQKTVFFTDPIAQDFWVIKYGEQP